MGAGSRPLMKTHGPSERTRHGAPYAAVGMQRALALGDRFAQEVDQRVRMLGFLTPAEVRSSFMRRLL